MRNRLRRNAESALLLLTLFSVVEPAWAAGRDFYLTPYGGIGHCVGGGLVSTAGVEFEMQTNHTVPPVTFIDVLLLPIYRIFDVASFDIANSSITCTSSRFGEVTYAASTIFSTQFGYHLPISKGSEWIFKGGISAVSGRYTGDKVVSERTANYGGLLTAANRYRLNDTFFASAELRATYFPGNSKLQEVETNSEFTEPDQLIFGIMAKLSYGF